MKKILIFFIISLLFISLISFVSAEKLSGSFTITGEAVEETSENNESGVTEDSFLNSIKNFFIYAFTMGGEFEISPPSREETEEEGGGGGREAIEPITELENKSDIEDYNETNKSIEEETPKEEVPWKIKESQTIFIIIIILIIILIIIILFLKRKLLKRKLLKLFKGRVKRKPKKRKKK